jgi:predicted transcriptional regulator
MRGEAVKYRALTMKITIEIEDELFEKVQALARVEKTNLSALIELRLRTALDEKAKCNLRPLPAVG